MCNAAHWAGYRCDGVWMPKLLNSCKRCSKLFVSLQTLRDNEWTDEEKLKYPLDEQDCKPELWRLHSVEEEED